MLPGSMERGRTLPSRAWSCGELNRATSYLMNQAVKEEPAQALDHRLRGMDAQQLQQQMLAACFNCRHHSCAFVGFLSCFDNTCRLSGSSSSFGNGATRGSLEVEVKLIP